MNQQQQSSLQSTQLTTLQKQKENKDEGNLETRTLLANKILQQYKDAANNQVPNETSSKQNNSIISSQLQKQLETINDPKKPISSNILQQINVNKDSSDGDQIKTIGEGISQKTGQNSYLNGLPPMNPKTSLTKAESQQQSTSQTNLRSSYAKFTANELNIPGIEPYEPYKRTHLRQSSMVNLANTNLSSQQTSFPELKGCETTTNNYTQQLGLKQSSEQTRQIIQKNVDLIKKQQDINSQANSQFKKEFLNQIFQGGEGNTGINSYEAIFNKNNRSSFDNGLPYDYYFSKQMKNSKKLENIHESNRQGDLSSTSLKQISISDRSAKNSDTSRSFKKQTTLPHEQINGKFVLEDSVINLTASVAGQNKTSALYGDSFSDRLLNFQYNKKDSISTSYQQNVFIESAGNTTKNNQQTDNSKNIAQNGSNTQANGPTPTSYQELKKSLIQQDNKSGQTQSNKQNLIDIYKYDITSKNIIAASNKIPSSSFEYNPSNIQKIKEKLVTEQSVYSNSSKEITPQNKNMNLGIDQFDLNSQMNFKRPRQSSQRAYTIAAEYPLPTQKELQIFEASIDSKFSFNGQNNTSLNNIPSSFTNKISIETTKDKKLLQEEQHSKTNSDSLYKQLIDKALSSNYFMPSAISGQRMKTYSTPSNNDDSLNNQDKISDLKFENLKKEIAQITNKNIYLKDSIVQKSKGSLNAISQHMSVTPSPRYYPETQATTAAVQYNFSKTNVSFENKQQGHEIMTRNVRSSSHIANPTTVKEYQPYEKLFTSHFKTKQQTEEDIKITTNTFNSGINNDSNNISNSTEQNKKDHKLQQKLQSTQFLDELLGRAKKDSQTSNNQQLSHSSKQQSSSPVPNSNYAFPNSQLEILLNKEIEKRESSNNNLFTDLQSQNQDISLPRKYSQFSGISGLSEILPEAKSNNSIVDRLKDEQQKEDKIIEDVNIHEKSIDDKSNSSVNSVKKDVMLESENSIKINEYIKNLKEQKTNNSEQTQSLNAISNEGVERQNQKNNQNQGQEIKESFGVFPQYSNPGTNYPSLISYNQENNNSFSHLSNPNISGMNSCSIIGQQTNNSIQQNYLNTPSQFLDPKSLTVIQEQFSSNNINHSENKTSSQNDNGISSQSNADNSLLENSEKLLKRKSSKAISINYTNDQKNNQDKHNYLNSNPFSIDKNISFTPNIFISPKFEGAIDNEITPPPTAPFTNNEKQNQTNTNTQSNVSPFDHINTDDFLKTKEILEQNTKILQQAYSIFNINQNQQLLSPDGIISDEKIAKILESNEKRNKQQEQMVQQNKELYEKIKMTLYGLDNDQVNQSQQKTLLLQERTKKESISNHPLISQQSDQSHPFNKITSSNDVDTKNFQKIPKIDLIQQNEKRTHSCQYLNSHSTNVSPINATIDIEALKQPLKQSPMPSSNSLSKDYSQGSSIRQPTVKHHTHFSSSSHHVKTKNKNGKSGFSKSPEKKHQQQNDQQSSSEQINNFIQNNIYSQQSSNSQIQQNKSANNENSSFRGEGSFVSSSSSNTINITSYDFNSSQSPILLKNKLSDNISQISIGGAHEQSTHQQPLILPQKVSYSKLFSFQNPSNTSQNSESQQNTIFQQVVVTQINDTTKQNTDTLTNEAVQQKVSSQQDIIDSQNTQSQSIDNNQVNSIKAGISNTGIISNILKQQQEQGQNNQNTVVTVEVMSVKQLQMPKKLMMKYFNPRNEQILFENFFKKENFRIGKHLGTGKFSEVHMAQDIKSGLVVALKKIKKQVLIKYKSEDYLENEIKIQLFFNHPNILKLYGFYYDEEFVYLVQEYASHGELYHELKKQPNKRFDEIKGATYMRQICDAFTYLHRQHVIHRDIKPENILMSFGVLKIADFGCSVYCPEDRRETFCGTIDYISPEIVNGESYGQSVDIWSLGILTYELLTGKSPFQYETKNEILVNILNVNIQIPDYLSDDAQDFLKSLLVRDPSKRLSMDQVINHKWITSNLQAYSADWDHDLAKVTKNLVV